MEKTIAGLATMDALESLARSTKEGFGSVNERFDRMDDRFDRMNDRFDRIENISIGGHERRIDNLEDRVRVIETKTNIKRS